MSASLHPIQIIQHKRDGLVLEDSEIRGFVHATTAGTVTDAQIAAFLTAFHH